MTRQRLPARSLKQATAFDVRNSQLPIAIKIQLKAPKAPYTSLDIFCLLLCLYAISALLEGDM